MFGVMQGRLSKSHTGKIQEFPSLTWQEEFKLANSIGIKAIEWTLDLKDFKDNPIFKLKQEVSDLQSEFQVKVPSITLDCFVEAPIHKRNETTGSVSSPRELEWIAESLQGTGVDILVLPIVAEAGKFSSEDLDNLIHVLNAIEGSLKSLGKRIAIECEFDLISMSHLLAELDRHTFGINFDMGNSASLGHNPWNELEVCKDRIFNVHIKDRLVNGHTVPLGSGSVQFWEVANALASQNYSGNMILQAARLFDRDEVEQICTYTDFCRELGWVNNE